MVELVRGIEKKDVIRGQVLAAPKSINPHTKFEAQIYVLTEKEGGRHSPFFTGYRPQFYFRTTDITGTVNLEAGVDMVKPGDNVKIIGELIHPIAMDEGLKLAIREGGRTIASWLYTPCGGISMCRHPCVRRDGRRTPRVSWPHPQTTDCAFRCCVR